MEGGKGDHHIRMGPGVVSMARKTKLHDNDGNNYMYKHEEDHRRMRKCGLAGCNPSLKPKPSLN